MTRRLALLAVFTLLSMIALAPAALAAMDVDGIEELLPREMSREEALHLSEYLEASGDRLATPPPLAPIRNVAEWEPVTGVLIRYPLGLPYDLLQDFDDNLTLHVIVSSASYDAAVSNMTANGVDMSHVQFLIKPNESIWTRDYGPWYVFDGNGDVGIIDHKYNVLSRPNDNLIPVHFAEQQGIPCYRHDMVHTGGNYMTDGAHIGCSTWKVYNEAWSYNAMPPQAVQQLMFDYYGIENYVVLDYIESGGIHHIDTWAKFLDEETVMVKDVPTSHATYNNLNQRAALLASLPSSTGRNYQVHRVYCYLVSSGPASYTNSLILNDHIYVPVFGDATYDEDAIAAFQEAAPGYTVQGYYYSGFLSDDALHCRAKGAYDVGMLRVAHVPIHEQQEGAVTVGAMVRDHSNTGVSAVELHYRQNGGAWQMVAMGNVGGYDYEGTIPAPLSDGTTDYYIHAMDNSGRDEGMPRVEPAAWYSFDHLTGDLTAVDGVTPARPAALHANYPNPFNPSTKFSFTLLYADQVELTVFDPQGRLVRTLIDGLVPAGDTSVTWDGRDDAGQALPSGVYLYRLRAAGLQYSRPATLLK